MEIMKDTKIHLVKMALKQAISYQDYRALTEQHALENTNSGAEVTEALANYTKLNHKRMKRLDKTLTLSEHTKAILSQYKKQLTWLVLTETWCGDAAQTLPVMHKFAQESAYIDLRIVMRDEHFELMDAFLYKGGRSIPKLIVYDKVNNVIIGDWGPRPMKATAMANAYKEAHGSLTPEFKTDLQTWYTTDKGQDTAKDLLKLLVD